MDRLDCDDFDLTRDLPLTDLAHDAHTVHACPRTLTIADVERIAALAHLELTDDEKQLFTKQLADILAYAEQVQAVDTTGVPPPRTCNAHEASNATTSRGPRLPVGEALGQRARRRRRRRSVPRAAGHRR